MPQGSALSLILYNFYPTEVIEDGRKIQVNTFAEDTTILSVSWHLTKSDEYLTNATEAFAKRRKKWPESMLDNNN